MNLLKVTVNPGAKAGAETGVEAEVEAEALVEGKKTSAIPVKMSHIKGSNMRGPPEKLKKQHGE